jgi:hypothetical protein
MAVSSLLMARAQARVWWKVLEEDGSGGGGNIARKLGIVKP